MAMTSRSFSYFDLTDELSRTAHLNRRLNNHIKQKNEGGHNLNVLIRMYHQEDLPNDVSVLEGTVFDEFVKTTRRIIRHTDLNGLPDYTIQDDPYIDIRAGDFWILNNGTLVNKRKGDRGFVSNAINHALEIDIHPYFINIEDIAADYTNNWLGGIVDRRGNWQKGTIHGDDLRRDNVIGQEFVACTKNQVGGYTQYFGGNTKFKVTREGVVTIYTDLNNNIEMFLNFVQDELQAYFVI